MTSRIASATDIFALCNFSDRVVGAAVFYVLLFRYLHAPAQIEDSGSTMSKAFVWLDSSTVGDTPLEIIFDTAVNALCALVSLGEINSSHHQLSHRLKLLKLINHFPVLCKTLRDRAYRWPVLSSLLFYERTRMGITNSGYFLEGCPLELPLFSGSCNVNVPDDDIAALRLRDVLADRMTTIAKLERLETESPKRKRILGDHQVDDLPKGTPGVVRVFVSRMRSICIGLQRVKPQNTLQQCQNCNCNRLFYKGIGAELVAPPVNPKTGTTLRPGECDSDDDVDGYWNEMESGHQSSSGAYNRRFCTSWCRVEWHRQLTDCMPVAKFNADDKCRKKGRARVNEAFRACLKRNEEASRAFRSVLKSKRVFPALSAAAVAKHQQRRVRRLNVDLGLLYAASVLAESAQLSASRVLPGMCTGWRSNPFYYRIPLRSAIKIYRKLNSDRSLTILTNPAAKPTFLEKMKRVSTTIF